MATFGSPGSRPTGVDAGDASSVIDTARIRVKNALKKYHLALTEASKLPDNSNKHGYTMQTKTATDLKMHWANPKPQIGHIQGIKVGDTFELRTELAVVGLHHPYQGGIEYLTDRGNKYAVSIVQSGRYDGKTYEDETQPPQCIIYIGQGGNPEITKGSPTDQKAERGNLALMNNKISEDPVRLIRRYKVGGKTGFVYDGLYTVLDWQQKTKDNGKLVFEFSLQRVPGQPTYKW